MKVSPGNIYSGSKRLAVLTNPTELAKRKGNLVSSYPVTVDGVEYRDSEQAYQSIKRGLDHHAELGELADLMVRILIVKLQTYPRIVSFIRENGGVKFLGECSHTVNGGRWEGVGTSSLFIRCLITAYWETCGEYHDRSEL